ncbi:MAG TPA: cupin domain-containing protein [Candidatus Limnocylindrales bacterium]|nr:cupin domain-containing protein [Candidatus Limnocylindrales bacterium]
MTYPPIRYHGPEGETSATLRRADAPHDLVYPSGTTVDYLATGASTDGLFGLYRWSMPGEGGPGPHFHRTMAESFYVLAGTITIYDGRAWRPCGPGDFVHVPPGGIHGFRNESGGFASMLIHFAPGAPREGYFEGNARFALDGRPGDDVLAAFYAEHDNLWIPEDTDR